MLFASNCSNIRDRTMDEREIVRLRVSVLLLSIPELDDTLSELILTTPPTSINAGFIAVNARAVVVGKDNCVDVKTQLQQIWFTLQCNTLDQP